MGERSGTKYIYYFLYQKERINDNPVFYLKQVLKFKVMEHYRDRKNIGITLSPTDDIHHEHVSVTAAMEAKEMSGAIATTIQAMLPQQRKVFLLSRQVNMTNREIATELGISVKTVEAHMPVFSKKGNFLL